MNFCKFTNETRNGDRGRHGQLRQVWIAAVNGTAAGGGYELALACDEILLVDDRASAVSLPEVPLLAVLPGTGGLTRVVDKRHVRRDLADVFATRTEGVKGQQAVDWGLVDAVAPRSAASTRWSASGPLPAPRVRPADRRRPASTLPASALDRDRRRRHPLDHVDVDIDRDLGAAHITVRAPDRRSRPSADELRRRRRLGAGRAPRELDDAILHLRFNEPEIGTWVLHTVGDTGAVLAAEDVLRATPTTGWSARSACCGRARSSGSTLSARTLVALVEPGSCFAGSLAELVLAADRSFMLDGPDPRRRRPPAATMRLTAANDGWYPMSNGLTRLATRFWGRDDALDHGAGHDRQGPARRRRRRRRAGHVRPRRPRLGRRGPGDARGAQQLLARRPDGMEANLRFVGPETMETKIFARLSAWQNWIFQRPNAVGPDGALRRFGTGTRPTYDRKRV